MFCLASSERSYCLREKLYILGLYYPNPQWRFPVWESCVDKLVETLLCEGGDIELGARISKHILVFAFDLLSLTLSLSHCALIHIVHIIYILGLFVCHTCVNQENFI